jgi:hypothetical protein
MSCGCCRFSCHRVPQQVQAAGKVCRFVQGGGLLAVLNRMCDVADLNLRYSDGSAAICYFVSMAVPAPSWMTEEA